MKNLYLWIFTMPFFISCTSDNEYSKTAGAISTTQNAHRITGMYPENAANGYDSAGQLHNDISEAYLASGTTAGTLATIIAQTEAIAFGNAEFLSLKDGSYTSPDPTRLQYIMDNGTVSMDEIISHSPMTAAGKASLTNFINTLMSYRDRQEVYDTIYLFIMDYESGVLSNSSYTAVDKRIILTTSSISRYAFYFASKHKRKPRDRDWDISMGNIVASIEDSESIAQDIVMSAAAGIAANN